MRKRIILPSIVALSILAIALQAKNVFADDLTNYPPIVQKIAERFNLDADEVEDFFSEERDERRAERFAFFADKLDDLVSEGELTQEQRNTILNKHEEIQDAVEDMGDLSKEERREKIQSMHEDFISWLEEQGIEDALVRGLGKGFLGQGHRGKFGREFMMDGGH